MGGCSFYGITITRFKLFVNENTMTKNNEINQITEGVIWKQLLIFFFPILIGTFFQQLYNTVDAVIVGRFVGKEALSAVGGSTSSLSGYRRELRSSYPSITGRRTKRVYQIRSGQRSRCLWQADCFSCAFVFSSRNRCSSGWTHRRTRSHSPCSICRFMH